MICKRVSSPSKFERRPPSRPWRGPKTHTVCRGIWWSSPKVRRYRHHRQASFEICAGSLIPVWPISIIFLAISCVSGSLRSVRLATSTPRTDDGGGNPTTRYAVTETVTPMLRKLSLGPKKLPDTGVLISRATATGISRAHNASAALRIFDCHPKKTFATISAKS
jgi:hypothetical protein